ncbi:MAG: transposase [Novosphingobium sp.]|nr:transposase [Novosphingobium sp.]
MDPLQTTGAVIPIFRQDQREFDACIFHDPTGLETEAGDEIEMFGRRVAEAEASELQALAKGIKRDLAAVRAAITEPWTTSPVEGQINRIKTIKRQMYGRAKYPLLRQRVLLAA